MSIGAKDPEPDTSPPIVWPVQEYVGSGELEEMFGVSRQRVHQLTSREDFPEPVARLKAGAFWRTADVRAWAEARGRVIHEAQEER